MATSLSRDLRRILEKTTADARQLAESACKAALENLAVHEKEYRPHMPIEQRELRTRLRARGRALGDKRNDRLGTQELHQLIELAAYEHWHRLLFTRFLTENNLLITDEANGSVPVTLEECEELAPELGARDGLDLASRFASRTVPGVFRRDDPVLYLPLALNDQVELRKLLTTLPSDCFKADDALGWTYQFWQAKRKKEINESGKRIGADELSPVTQLFTEDYMVEFLLHNTLGAWWAAKCGPITAETEEEARAKVALRALNGIPAITWTYLRFVQHEKTKTWSPAAGTFDGWPSVARDTKLLDPSMGSGHFLVFALPLLARLRIEEEGLSSQAAVVAVLKDNIHGLELDERCTQIAAFNLALTAWKLAGYQQLPTLHLACSGLAPRASEAEWTSLAGDNDRLARGMARLHRLFKDAPVLGSLINPRAHAGGLIEADYHELAPLLNTAFQAEPKRDDDRSELAVVAQGIAKAAELLAARFTLVITNVPYLGRGKQDDVLKDYCERVHPSAKADLSTCFIERCLAFCTHRGTAAQVTPQSWLFQAAYADLRKELLTAFTWDVLARLGANAFQDMNWWAAVTLLSVFSKSRPSSQHTLFGIDVGELKDQADKASLLATKLPLMIQQELQRTLPKCVISFEASREVPMLYGVAKSTEGLSTGDADRYMRKFWELAFVNSDWEFFQVTTDQSKYYAGMSELLFWQKGKGELATSNSARIQGHYSWNKRGVLISRMNRLKCSLYFGTMYDKMAVVLVPKDCANLPALWAFCSSSAYYNAVRAVSQNVAVATSTLAQVPFDQAHWTSMAKSQCPNGLPKPFSCDPTQWLFDGHPKGSDQPLHVAVARLLGYRWPRQTGSSFPDCPALGPDPLDRLADEDGIVCLAPLNREQPGAPRLRQLLTTALGSFDERALIAKSGLKGGKATTLEEWLRDEFFEQHAALFEDRPFIWHLWDGRKDGFHVLVNYHRLDHATLQKLTYSYLGNWIQQQAEDAKADKPGAAERLGAARDLQSKLAAILEGEAPLDIFIRWKRMNEQASGWNPDLKDGVRQNIRPFLLAGDVGKRGAGLFRAIPLPLKDKDRGGEPDREKHEYPWFWCEGEPGTDPVGGDKFVGTRWNNAHLTLKRKTK